MPQRAAARTGLIGFAILMTMLVPSAASAATWTAFGPEVFLRSAGRPTTVTRTFSVLNPGAVYVLQVLRSSGQPPQNAIEITLNGARVQLGPAAPLLPVAGWAVQLRATNQLSVELRGSPGESVSVKVVGIDTDVPTISGALTPIPPASGWLKTNGVVSFTCADATSGIASCTPPVTVSGEGANQGVNGTAIDLAGNQASTSVAVSIDKTAPTIQATLNPQPNAAGWNTGAVTVTFVCTDALSGIASCTPPSTVSGPGSHTIAGVAIDLAGNQTSLSQTVKIATSFFTLRNYGGKCLDVGPLPQAGGGVYLNTCNGSAGQQIRVEELGANHQVRLYAGALVIGVDYDPTAVIDDGSGGSGVSEGPLTLQVPATGPSLLGTRQLFALDGDSIISLLDRSMVAQVNNASSAIGTPIVLRHRRLIDAEFWDFVAVDGSNADPTTGFVRIETVCDLTRRLALQAPGQPPDECPGPPTLPAGPGTVLRIAPGTVLEMTGLYQLQLPTGVTIRGGRRGLELGARLCMALHCDENNAFNVPGGSMLEIVGSDVRITGLRIEGPSRRTDPDVQTTHSIVAHDSPTLQYARTIIDNNDISGWTGAAVQVTGQDGNDDAQCDIAPPQIANVFVRRNFLHHNREQEKGYGVVTGKGGFPLIEGNTFLANRHAIAAAGGGHTGYFARFNLVLSEAPLQVGYGPFDWHTHDFDQHGNGSNGFGGTGGLYQDIFRNTFLGTNRANYELRSDPCYKTDFRENVSLVARGESVDYKPQQFLPSSLYDVDSVVNIQGVPSQFNQANPTNALASGDFDGDGTVDMFLATGAAWYYAPGGAREWRHLSNNAAPLSFLRFGDFDGDGRTDVVAKAGATILVSWGGASGWETLNAAAPPGFVTDLAVGKFVSDFPGDRRDDLFYSSAGSWFVSSGGAATFLETNTSGFHADQLRFGDFDGDGVTDVFGITSNVWQVSYGSTAGWSPLPASLTNSIDGLMVADFDGDGHADVAKVTDFNVAVSPQPTTTVLNWTLAISYSGQTGWASHVVSPTSSCALTFDTGHLTQAGFIAGIADVDGVAGADVIGWGAKDGNNFCLISSGTGAAERLSGQDMR